MEIKLSHNLGAVTRLANGPARPRETKAPAENVAFNRAEALNKALDASPGARPEVVARARALVEDSNYPPPETIKRIANLLALHLDADSE